MKHYGLFLKSGLILLFFLLSVVPKSIGQIDPDASVKKEKIHLKKTIKNTILDDNRKILDSEKSPTKSISIKKKGEEFLVFDWMVPLTKKIFISGDEIEIKLKVISSEPIEKEDIIVFKNGQRLGSKADEVSLFGNNSKTEFTYSNTIKLSEGLNEIRIGVNFKGAIKKSSPKVLEKKGESVTDVTGEEDYTLELVQSKVYWVEPDPLAAFGQPIVKNDRNLKIALIVRCDEELDKSHLKITNNNAILQPSFKSKLKKLSEGKYMFEDHVQLNEQYELNVLRVQVSLNDLKIESEPLLVDFTPFRPNLFILSIGTETNLAYTEKDARDFSDLYASQGGKLGNRLFNTVNVQTLLGGEATAGEIKGRIEELIVKLETGNISENDVIILFISSHGFMLDEEFRIQGDDYDPSRKLSTSVSYQKEIADILEKLPCKKLVFIDACHSGGSGARANISDINYEIEKLNRKKQGLTAIVSSKGDEESYEDIVWQNGAFTEAIIQGLKQGKADSDNNQIVTIDELYYFIQKYVAKIVSKVKRKPQHPVLIKNDLGDLAIYVVHE